MKILLTLLLVACSVTLAYGDCTVGGKALKLQERLQGAKDVYTYFGTSDGSFAVDKNGVQYSQPFAGLNGASFEGELRAETEGGADLRKVETVEDGFKDITVGKYRVTYFLNGDKLAEFTGTFNKDLYVMRPYVGTFKLACGETWVIGSVNPKINDILLVEMSPEGKRALAVAHGERDKAETASKAKRAAADAAEKKALAKWRKTLKLGAKVVSPEGNQRGTVTKIKGDMVEVQYTEVLSQRVQRSGGSEFKVGSPFWQRMNPVKEWAARADVRCP